MDRLYENLHFFSSSRSSMRWRQRWGSHGMWHVAMPTRMQSNGTDNQCQTTSLWVTRLPTGKDRRAQCLLASQLEFVGLLSCSAGEWLVNYLATNWGCQLTCLATIKLRQLLISGAQHQIQTHTHTHSSIQCIWTLPTTWPWCGHEQRGPTYDLTRYSQTSSKYSYS